MSEYIEFRLSKQLPKTSVWEVLSKKHGNVLGVVKYYGAWRQYAFFPSNETIWNTECLTDIIEFLKKQNYLRKGIEYKPVKPSVTQAPDHITFGGPDTAVYEQSTEEWLLKNSVKSAKERPQKISDQELLDYIKNRTYRCRTCSDLKKEVLERGLTAIDAYDGMICGGVEDMFIKRGRY